MVVSSRTQMMAEQDFRQGPGDPINGNSGSRGTVDRHRLDPAEVKGLLPTPPSDLSPLVQADTVDRADGGDGFSGDDLGLHQEIARRIGAANLPPEQISLKPLVPPDLLADRGQGQLFFQEGGGRH
jgi:hypothetical protein